MLVATAMSPLLMSCVQPLPRFAARSDAESLAVLASRADGLRSFAGSGTLVVQSPEQGAVTLDVAVVARQPDQFRIRAWKLGQSAADILLNGDEVRIKLDDRVQERGLIEALRSVREALLAVDSEFFLHAEVQPDSDDALFVVRGVTRGGVHLRCEIDRATLTIQRVHPESNGGHEPDGTNEGAYIALERYRIFEGTAWPTRIRAIDDEREATLRFDWLERNADIAPGALPPPAEAASGP